MKKKLLGLFFFLSIPLIGQVSYSGFIIHNFEKVKPEKLKEITGEAVESYWYSGTEFINETDTFGYGGESSSFDFEVKNQIIQSKKLDWQNHKDSCGNDSTFWLLKRDNGYLSADSLIYHIVYKVKFTGVLSKPVIDSLDGGRKDYCPVQKIINDQYVSVNTFLEVTPLFSFQLMKFPFIKLEECLRIGNCYY